MNNIYKGNYFQIEVKENDIIINPSNFKDTTLNIKWFNLIDDLDVLIREINANPPQFKEEISEEDQIHFLQILNRLKKNNKLNLSEDELEELALLQFHRDFKKNQKEVAKEIIKEEVNYNDSIIPSYNDAPPPPLKKGRDWGETVKQLQIEATLTPTYQLIQELKDKSLSNGVNLNGKSIYLYELTDEEIGQLVANKKQVSFGKIFEVPKMLTREALNDDNIVARINADNVQVSYKRDEKTEFDSLKGIGGTPR